MKTKTRVICLLMACVVLVSAITVSAVNGSPYEQLKNAMLDVLFYENYTMEAEVTIKVNGAIEEGMRTFISQGYNSSLSIDSEWYATAPEWLYTETVLTTVSAVDYFSQFEHEHDMPQWYNSDPVRVFTSPSAFDHFDDYETEVEYYFDEYGYDYTTPPLLQFESGFYHVDAPLYRNHAAIEADYYYVEEKVIIRDIEFNPNGEFIKTYMSYNTPVLSLNETKRWNPHNSFNVTVYNNPHGVMNRRFNQRLVDEMFYGENIERDSNSIRFMELLADLFIGDLRNNVSMSTQNGIRYFSGEITGVQVPEILRLIADIAVEDGHMWITDDILAKGISINRIRGDAQVDSLGNLIYLAAHMGLTITDEHGVTHTVDVDMSFKFYDIGTSNPQSPVQGVDELFTLDYMRRNFTAPQWEWGNYRATFTLDEYGNIDMESIRE